MHLKYFPADPSATEDQWPDITGGGSLWDTPPVRPPQPAASVTMVTPSNMLAHEKQQQELRIKVFTRTLLYSGKWSCSRFSGYCSQCSCLQKAEEESRRLEEERAAKMKLEQEREREREKEREREREEKRRQETEER